MDTVETAQDEGELLGEAAGYSLADHQALREVSGERARVSQPELLVNLQAVETDDKGMRDNQEHLIPFKPPWIRNAGLKQGCPHRECEPGIGSHEHNHHPKVL